MKKDTALTIALPKSKLQPPPKKSEIIDALTRLEIEKRNKQLKADVDKRKALVIEAEKELIEFAMLSPRTFALDADLGSRWSNRDKLSGIRVYIEIDERYLPAELKKKIKEIHALPEDYREAQFHYVRKEIAAAVNGMASHTERVEALLSNDDSKKSLEEMLEVLSK